MNGNLFELLGIPDPEVSSEHTSTSAPSPTRPSMLIPSGPARLCLQSFLAERYPLRHHQRQPFRSTPIQVDDRKLTDRSKHFCGITVHVPLAISDRFTLELVNPPWNAEVLALIQERRGQWIDGAAETKIIVPVRLKNHGFLRQLARAIRNVINFQHVKRTGQRYAIADWRWLAGRTADSLDTLADLIWEFRKKRASPGRQSLQTPATRGTRRSLHLTGDER